MPRRVWKAPIGVQASLIPPEEDASAVASAPLPAESARPSIKPLASPVSGLDAIEIPHSADTTYLSHGYFRYIGKYPPQLVSYVLNKYPVDGPVVDPMCGGGTTLTEAYLRGLPARGFDVNPVARLTSRVVSTPLEPEALRKAASEFLQELSQRLDADAKAAATSGRRNSIKIDLGKCEQYFSKETKRDLHQFLAAVRLQPAEYQDAFLMTLLSILRRVSRANIKKMNLEIDESRTDPPRLMAVYPSALEEIVSRNREFWKYRRLSKVAVDEADAQQLPLESATAGAVFLHPPYMTNTAFSEFSQLQLSLLGIDHRSIWKRELRCRGSFLHEPNGVRKYLVGWSKIIQEAARVVRPGGTVTAVVGDGQIDYVRIPVGSITAEFASDAGLETCERKYHVFNNNTGQTQSRKMVGHHLFVFRKPVR